MVHTKYILGDYSMKFDDYDDNESGAVERMVINVLMVVVVVLVVRILMLVIITVMKMILVVVITIC